VGLTASTRDLEKKKPFPLLGMQTGFFRPLFRSLVPVLSELTHHCLKLHYNLPEISTHLILRAVT